MCPPFVILSIPRIGENLVTLAAMTWPILLDMINYTSSCGEGGGILMLIFKSLIMLTA